MTKRKKVNKQAMATLDAAMLGPEPSFSYDHKISRMEYMQSLNWYAATLTREDSKHYVTSFLRTQRNKSFLKKVQRVPHVHFSPTYGAIARMIANDLLIPETGPKWLDKNLNLLIEKYAEPEDKTAVVEKKPVDIQARTNARARAIAGEIDDIFEDNVWFNTNKLDDNYIFNFLHKKNVSGVVAQKVTEILTPHLDELKSVKKDPQLKEAYSRYSKKEIVRFIDFYQDVVDTCLNYSVNSKKSKVRKPRAKKEVPADKKVGGMKYLKLYTPYQLASINPSKVLGASQVWLFDTRYTKLTMLNAIDRGGIDVKGQTFLNVDKKSSVTKKAGRNTKLMVESILRASKPQCRKTLENITARPGKLQLRTNANILILRTF